MRTKQSVRWGIELVVLICCSILFLLLLSSPFPEWYEDEHYQISSLGWKLFSFSCETNSDFVYFRAFSVISLFPLFSGCAIWIIIILFSQYFPSVQPRYTVYSKCVLMVSILLYINSQQDLNQSIGVFINIILFYVISLPIVVSSEFQTFRKGENQKMKNDSSQKYQYFLFDLVSLILIFSIYSLSLGHSGFILLLIDFIAVIKLIEIIQIFVISKTQNKIQECLRKNKADQ